MSNIPIQELKEILQSSNINFLLGAGVSVPYLPILGPIEKKLNEAATEEEKIPLYKEYFTGVMLPNMNIIRKDYSDGNLDATIDSYKKFFLELTSQLIKRKGSILNKQVNVFTTNIDVMMEVALEKLAIDYNDGFSGKFNPTFGLANFKKSIFQRSLHFDHRSEVPVFNIIKVHGSLSWKHDDSGEKIIFSSMLEHLNGCVPASTDEAFLAEYKKILVVNPEEAKHLESVLNIYYSELLRLYSSELEKENATLFVLGFSMGDVHIKEITLRAAKSNPTLRIFVGCSLNSKEQMETKMEITKHPNIQMLCPNVPGEKYTLKHFVDFLQNKPLTSEIVEQS